MSVSGIDAITFGASDLATCRKFFADWGLSLVSEGAQELVFESLNGCQVTIAQSDKPGLPAGMEPDPTVREVVWGVETEADLAHRMHRPQRPGDPAAGVAQAPAGTGLRPDQHLGRAPAREPAQPGL
jgi:catechol 2,3-dioxygenase-like lactoylglutathione lyase family enzyme